MKLANSTSKGIENPSAKIKIPLITRFLVEFIFKGVAASAPSSVRSHTRNRYQSSHCKSGNKNLSRLEQLKITRVVYVLLEYLNWTRVCRKNRQDIRSESTIDEIVFVVRNE